MPALQYGENALKRAAAASAAAAAGHRSHTARGQRLTDGEPARSPSDDQKRPGPARRGGLWQCPQPGPPGTWWTGGLGQDPRGARSAEPLLARNLHMVVVM